MNSNELNKAVMKIIQQEIEPMVTEYMQQHPEYFHPCVSGNGFICSHNITLSFQPDTLSDVANIKPTIFIELGNMNLGHKLACYDHHPKDLVSTFIIDGNYVVEKEIPNV